jgi:hypothetical protein
MSEPESPGIPPPPQPQWWLRPLRLFTRPKLPGWAFFLFLAIQWIPDWKSRVDFWLDAAEKAGGYSGQAATVISSPYFSLGVAGIGVLWLAFVGEPSRGILRDPRWRYIGWSIVAILMAVVSLTVGYGYFEIRVQEIAAGRPRFPDRHITDQQKDNLRIEIPKIKQEIGDKKIHMGAVNGDRESMHYASEFLEIFADLGVLDEVMHPKHGKSGRVAVSLNSNDQTMHGILIGVTDKEKPPVDAQALYSGLWRSGFVPTFVNMDSAGDQLWIIVDQPP